MLIAPFLPKDIIYNYLEELSNHILQVPNQSKYPNSLMVGMPGKIIFLAYYSRLTGNEAFLDVSISNLESLFDNTTIDNTDATSFGLGLAGLAWTLNLFIKERFVEVEGDPLEVYDELFFELAVNELSKGIYDYMHGGMGYGLIFIERVRSVEALQNKLKVLVSILEETAIRDKGIYWRDPSIKDKVSINLGLAHGIPSLLILLGRLYNIGIEKEKVLSLGEGIIECLSQVYIKDDVSCFPPTFEFDA